MQCPERHILRLSPGSMRSSFVQQRAIAELILKVANVATPWIQRWNNGEGIQLISTGYSCVNGVNALLAAGKQRTWIIMSTICVCIYTYIYIDIIYIYIRTNIYIYIIYIYVHIHTYIHGYSRFCPAGFQNLNSRSGDLSWHQIPMTQMHVFFCLKIRYTLNLMPFGGTLKAPKIHEILTVSRKKHKGTRVVRMI